MTGQSGDQQRQMQRASALVLAVVCLPVVVLLGFMIADYLGSRKPEEYLYSMGLLVALAMILSEDLVFRMLFWDRLPKFIRRDKSQSWFALIIAGFCALSGIEAGMTVLQMAWSWVNSFVVIISVFVAVMFGIDYFRCRWRAWGKD